MLEIRERQTSPEVAALPGFVSAMCLYKHELSSRKKLFQKDIVQRIVTIFATETPRNINRMAKIKVQNTEITIINHDDKDYISLTDMVRNIENGLALIEKWLRNKNTIEFLGIWEEMYNPDFNSPEFEGIKNEAGLNRFILSVKQWTEKTNSRGLIAKAGRYGGTYAHKDIAFEFASWVSPQFKLYLLKEFQRLKEQEQTQLGWSAKRELSKINYRIHTDAIKQNLIPAEVTAKQASIIYADEADMLNVAMFGMTAKMWREQHPELKGNIRDYASINELICLSNMENLNATKK